ncbi:enoyl-[acyl-carrier-protein] reductase, mitochondrial-like [Lucilia sericata]|uniref:enoyl-[acyl-carrier-protein] reductase, mitochondrial-like n=1 Tax=Lucilia sericata TaxID=13632 RepID=UPI0018A85905|nr:enoyl-[acyl-carrier-protein] reductase, mitochondrial-like [Lucilia sericata]
MFLKNLLKSRSSSYNFQKRFIKTLSLKFSGNGEPTQVLEMVEEELPEPENNQVLVRVLMAPINPSDINIIQGRYPLQPAQLPATAGNEFVGEIVQMGDKVENFAIKEQVVAYESGLGTWSQYLLLNAEQIYAVPYELPLTAAATLTINPCTAYRMLKDFVKLKPGDCIIQNGANSAVGQAVHQLCKYWGLKSVGVVRERPELVKLKQDLLRLGATEIFTEEELVKTQLFKNGCLPKPRLALNCVGGESASNIAKLLDYQGIMVTYGGMARKPISVPIGPLIFKKHIYQGFWITEWVKRNKCTWVRSYMLKDIIQLMLGKEFIAPKHTLIPFQQYKAHAQQALTLASKTNRKFIFDMRENECN